MKNVTVSLNPDCFQITKNCRIQGVLQFEAGSSKGVNSVRG